MIVRVRSAARSACVLVVLLAASSITSAPAAAQPFQQSYRRLIREAVAEFDDGNWAEARALFSRAHELQPNARTLRGIGMCSFELREYEDAIDYLEQALESEERALTRRLREETELLLVRARSFIGHFVVNTEPVEAELLVDGAPPALNDNGQIVLPLGEHTFEASLAGYQTEHRQVRVRGGEALEVTLTLDLLPEPVAEPLVPDTVLALWIAAAGVLVVDAVAIGWLVDRESELGICRVPPDGFTCGNESALSDQRDAALGSLIAASVVAVGLAGVGLLLWLLTEPSGDEDVACGPGGCAVLRF